MIKQLKRIIYSPHPLVFSLMIICVSSIFSCAKLNLKNSFINPKIKYKEINNLKNIWSKNFDGQFPSGNLPISSAGAFVDRDFVFASNQNGTFFCMDKTNGRVVWSKKSKGSMSTSPVSDSKNVYFGTSLGRFYSLNKKNGNLNYEVDLGSGIITPPTFYKGRLFVHANNHRVISLDQKTGKILWAYTRSVPYSTTIQGAAKIIVHKGKLIIGFSDGYITSFRIEDGVLLWEKKIAINNKFIDIDFQPVLFHGQLFLFSQDEVLTVVNPNNGNIIKKYEIFPSSILKYNSKIMVGTNKGKILIINANNVERRINLSRFSINKIVSLKNGFFISDLGGHIYYLNSSLKVIWKKHLGHPYSTVMGDISSYGNYLALLTSRQKLYVYSINDDLK